MPEVALLEIENFDHLLRTTRSVRRNLDLQRPIERSVLLDCIDNAVQAPTGLAGENWRFVVVDERQAKNQLALLYGEVLTTLLEQRGMDMKPTHNALLNNLPEMPALIFVCAPCRVRGSTQDTAAEVAYYGSILPAAWSLMLSLRVRGIGATWTTLLSARQSEVAEIVQMPDDHCHLVMLPVGYTKNARLKPADRKPADEVTYFNQWPGM
ncbi:MAG: nitroreductase family protein [Pseudomonadaceae bacterium]|nr:nitroreductase family protein [Pseudomonadaceae bacterium]